jgi:hypothetical protein
MKGLVWAGLIGLLGLAVIRSVFDGGDSVIRGMGNSANRIYVDPVRDELAAAIAAHEGAPAITAEELAETFAAIRQRAREGDLEAALVLFRVAEMQRVSSHK